MPAASRALESPDLALAQRAKRVDARCDGNMEDVEIVIGQDSKAAGAARVVRQSKSLVARRGSRDPVGVDHEIERAEALADAEHPPLPVTVTW